MTIALHPVPAPIVGSYWPGVLPEIEMIATRCNEQWSPEHVRAEIARGHATLCMAFDEGAPIGFMIHQIATTAYSKDLHIWLAGGSTLERMQEFWPLIRQIAKRHGCKAITFESPRRWERALKFLEIRYLYREGI